MVAAGTKNGVPARTYKFQVTKLGARKSGRYSDLMVAACRTLGMKPVCDYASYCRLDYHSLYIGQTGHISFFGKPSSKDPAGFSRVQAKWRGLCFYTGRAKADNALCNIPRCAP